MLLCQQSCRRCVFADERCHAVGADANPCTPVERLDRSTAHLCGCTRPPEGGAGVDVCSWYGESTAAGTDPALWRGGDFLPGAYVTAAQCACTGNGHPLWTSPVADCLRAQILTRTASLP